MTSLSPELFKLPVLSIRQPWAWLTLHAGKDIENRNWRTSLRGRFLIHAAKGCTQAEYKEALSYARFVHGTHGKFLTISNLPPLTELERGGIVGMAEIVDCVSNSSSMWFFGNYGFVLRNAQPLPFFPCKGQLGFFHLNAKSTPST